MSSSSIRTSAQNLPGAEGTARAPNLAFWDADMIVAASDVRNYQDVYTRRVSSDIKQFVSV